MLAFFRGLELSTPINSGVIITLSPVLVLILSYFFLKERVTIKKIVGILIGFSGAVFLILNSNKVGINAPNIPLGNSFFLLNASAYAGYLIVVKPLTKKYNIFTLMKWLFLVGLFLSTPLTYNQFIEVNWSELPWFAIWRMMYVVIGTTFLTYLFNIYALNTLSPTTVGSFIYLQPIITIIFASNILIAFGFCATAIVGVITFSTVTISFSGFQLQLLRLTSSNRLQNIKNFL